MLLSDRKNPLHMKPLYENELDFGKSIRKDLNFGHEKSVYTIGQNKFHLKTCYITQIRLHQEHIDQRIVKYMDALKFGFGIHY